MRLIREGTAKFMSENLNIEKAATETLFDIGLFREDVARRVLIRNEFNQEARPGNKTDFKWELADKYDVNTSTFEKTLCKSG